eukprot:CAMPEP_0118933084 /NCGR_PEP_ID=MMETSP1169-20130426/11241_1 /TAXON_ID=36882 /ORGANISM="Pyramimonas obovata, Strain CCMP722" /LENGTH=93 /DNA_ID=CAMNT_0006875807 /DNA_START=59 /DNA_END=340 /DNA_ORIENTATION=+
MALQASSLFGTRLVAAPAVSARTSSGPKQVTTCMAKKKGIRVVVTIECTEARKEGGTPSRYTTEKNRKNTPDKLELVKYNKFLRRRTLHKEIK